MTRYIFPSFLFFLALILCGDTALAQLSVNKKTQNFGIISLYSESSTTFELTNPTSADITISNIVCSSSQMQATCSSMTLAPKGSALLTVTNHADFVGHFTRAVYLYTTTSKHPLRLTLKGRVFFEQDIKNYQDEVGENEGAFAVDFGDLAFSTDNIEFDYVNDGDVVSKIIFVTNKGEQNCKPNLLHLPKYLSVKSSPEILRPGRKGYLTVTLDTRRLDHDFGLTQDVVYASSYEGESVSSDNEIPVSIVLLDTATVAQSYLAPTIQLSTRELLMPLNNKAKAKGVVAISNTGHSPLEIKSLQVFHPAVNVSMPKTTIMPGQTVNMKVTLVKKYLDRSNARHRILMTTNDYQNRAVLISIKH